MPFISVRKYFQEEKKDVPSFTILHVLNQKQLHKVTFDLTTPFQIEVHASIANSAW